MSDPLLAIADAFQLERAVVHDGAVVADLTPLAFVTPPECWAYAVSLPATWPPSADWIHKRDGAIRIRTRVAEGSVSILAADASGAVIDETFVRPSAVRVDVDLVSTPLGACDTVVIRNARADGRPSRGDITALECIDLGPSEQGDELTAPEGLALRPVDNWSRYYGTAQSITDRLRSARYSRLDRVKRMPWLKDLKVNVCPNDDLSRALYISGLYEPLTQLVLRRVLSPGATFIDVGANVGLFSMLASRWVGPGGRVYAIEPSEREYGRLLDHVALNALTNITAVRRAIGDRDGVAALRVAAFPNAGHNTLGVSFAYPDVPTARVEYVEITTLDSFVRAQLSDRVDAVKMDIEGSECAAIAGASEVLHRLRPVLVVEVCHRALAECSARAERLIGLLTSARYRGCRIGSDAELIPLAAGEIPPDGNIVAVPTERGLI